MFGMKTPCDHRLKIPDKWMNCVGKEIAGMCQKDMKDGLESGVFQTEIMQGELLLVMTKSRITPWE